MEDKSPSLLKGVFLAQAILILHAFLVIGIGLMILFFSGLVNYAAWLLIGGIAIIAGMVYITYRKAKKQGRQLQEILTLPHFAGKNLEITILGGMASIKVENAPNPSPYMALEDGSSQHIPQIESPVTIQVTELSKLAALLEKNLITEEEFMMAKRKILNVED